MKKLYLALCVLLLLALVFLSGACSNTSTITTTTSFKPGGVAVVNSDSAVTARIQSIQKQSSDNSWQLDVFIQTSADVGNLPNPVKTSIGKTVTVFAAQDLSGYQVGDVITGNIKYGGDVNIPGGIRLMLSNVSKSNAY